MSVTASFDVIGTSADILLANARDVVRSFFGDELLLAMQITTAYAVEDIFVPDAGTPVVVNWKANVTAAVFDEGSNLGAGWEWVP